MTKTARSFNNYLTVRQRNLDDPCSRFRVMTSAVGDSLKVTIHLAIDVHLVRKQVYHSNIVTRTARAIDGKDSCSAVTINFLKKKNLEQLDIELNSTR